MLIAAPSTRAWISAYGTSAAEAQADSKSIEARYLKEASSKEDYYRLCAVMVAALSKYSPTTSLTKIPQAPAAETLALDADDHLLQRTGSSDVATYAHTTSHDSGALSTMYEAYPKTFSEECPSAGQQVGPYANATFHATGAFSTVYKAHSANPPQFLALKVTSSKSKEPHNPLREARVLQRAVHPSVISLFSTSTDGKGHLILVFPFLPLDLEAWIGQKNSSPERLSPFAPKLLHNIFSALAHIHSLGIIHHEVKILYDFASGSHSFIH